MTPEGLPRQIARYQIVAELGRGGFGRVYRAIDPTVGRSVAIKVLTEASPEILNRFRNEAMVAGNLHHENIVTVYEYGEYERRPFLVMEYLEGEDLQHIIASHKQLSLLQKCNIMSQVAEGLYCAHRNGVVHRDVKPANIMVLPDGLVKIMDFGIARLTQDRDKTRLTQQGHMVGTLLYMAPEQFSGADVDALCDIFAYGVIYFELLTGRHPFETDDARVFMYRMSIEDPPPIGNFTPGLPDALQRIINRILQKDRELRYQSLKEVQFDLEPIRIELQQAHAATLLVQAQDLFRQQQLDAAFKVVLEVLSLDPANREARTLWETLQKQIQYRTLQPRIEALLSAGEEHLARRRYADAVQSFETAARLDRENTQIQSRLDNARTLFERGKRVARAMVEAKREFERQNFAAAQRSLSEALSQDPQNSEALQLAESVQQAIEVRQREVRLESAVNKAAGLLLSHSYDEATALLTELGPDAESPKVQAMLARVQSEKQEQERAQRLRSEMARASDLLRERRAAEAVQCLEALRTDFPENQELGRILSYAQLELDAQTRAKAIEQTTADVATLLKSNQFGPALAAIEKALGKYPGESVLVRLLGSARAAQADWERQQSVAAVLVECAALRKQQRFAEAVELLETTLREDSAEPTLVAFLREVEAEWARFKHAETVRKAAEEGQKLLDQKQAEKAAQWLRQALVETPDEPALLALLSRARLEVQKLETARAVEAVKREAASLATAREYAKAIAALDRGLKTWSDETSLMRQRDQTVAAKTAWERQQAIQAGVRSVTQLEKSGQLEQALDMARKLVSQYPAETEVVQLEARIAQLLEQSRRRAAVQAAATSARKFISESRLEEALEVLKAASLKYTGEADLETLTTQTREAIRARDRALEIDQRIQKSGEFLLARQFDAARKTIEEALQKYSGDAALRRQLEVVSAAEAAWRREQLIQQVVGQANALAGAQRFDEALQILAKSAKELKNEAAILDAQRQIGAAQQEAKRREAVAKAAADVEALIHRGGFEEALERLRDASTRYPGEAAWAPLLSRAQDGLQARQRAEERGRAIRAVVSECGELAKKGRFAEGLEVVAKALKQYGDEKELIAARKSLQEGFDLQKRSEAISRIAAGARTSIEQGRFVEARDALLQASKQYPGEAALDSLRTRAEEEIEARRRRDEALKKSNVSLVEERFEEVATLLSPLLERFPGDSEILSLLSDARERLEAKRRAEAIQKLVQDVTARVDQQDFQRALELLDNGLKTWPGEKQLVSLRGDTQAKHVKWQLQQALQQALQTAKNLAKENRFGDALKAVQDALAKHPDEPELLQLRQEYRIRKALVDADQSLKAGRPREALRMLEELGSECASKPDVAAMISRARDAVRVLERSEAIEAQAREARLRSEQGDLDGALDIADSALRKWPDAGSLIQIRKVLISAIAERERRTAIEDDVQLCEMAEKEGRLDQALDLVKDSLTKYPDEPALVKARDRLTDKLLKEEQRQALLHDLQELRSLTTAMRQAPGLTRVSEIAEIGHRIAARNPDEQEVRSLEKGLTQVLSDLQAAEKGLVARDFAAVLEICGKYIAEKPPYAAFENTRERAQGGQKVDYLADLQRRADAEPDLDLRVRILEEGLKRYPDERKISDDLRFVRNKLELVKSIVARAKAAEAAGRWDDALEQWKSLTAIHGQYPGLDPEMKRVLATRDKAQSDAIARWVDQIERLLQAGDLAKTGDMVRQALVEHPEAPAIQELARRLEETKRKKKLARELFTQAQSVLSADWRRAEELLNEAVALQAGVTAPSALVNAIADRKKEASVTDSLARANQLRSEGDSRSALAEVDRALATYPGESRLRLLKELLATEVRKERNRRVSELQSLLHLAQTATTTAEIEPLPARIQAITADYPQDAELKALAEQTLQALQARRRELRTAKFRNVFVANRKWIVGIVAGFIVALGLLLAVRAYLNSHHDVALTIESPIAGVAITVGSKTCETPNCDLDLPPGAYTVTASKNGYQTATQPLTIVAKQPKVNLSVALTPLPQLVQVSTNFESGKVYVDGHPTGDLRDGQFTVPDVSPGSHTLRVTGGDAEFETKWESAPASSPHLLGPIAAKNVQAVVLSSAGSNGSITCNCSLQTISVDGATAGAPDASGSTAPLTNLKEGSREIAIGDHKLVVDVRPNPALNVLLTADRNVGELIVNTSEDNVRISVNGRVYPRTTEHGAVRIPLAVGSYSIRVEKNGFQAVPPQKVDVPKGQEIQMHFTLTPVASTLEITAAVPGAQVKVDGRAVGETNASGGFHSDVPPGNHTIELSKDGYTSARFETQFTPGATNRPAASQLAMTKTIVAPDPKQVAAQEWERIHNSNSPEELEDFIRRHPGDSHNDEARARVTELRQAAARQTEQAAWNSVDQTRKSALQDYLNRFENGPHAQTARDLITGINRQETEAAAAAQRAREQKELESKQQEQAKRALADQQAIVKTLGDYEAAFGRKDLKGLHAIWSEMPPDVSKNLANEFSIAKTIVFQMRPSGTPLVNGDSATVDCTRSTRVTTTGGDRTDPVTDRVRVTLSRTGSGWVIKSIAAR